MSADPASPKRHISAQTLLVVQTPPPMPPAVQQIAVQEPQSPPVLPQAFFSLPCSHVPFLQQPPLHRIPAEGLQELLQTPLLHARPSGHCELLVQPQTPPVRQTGVLEFAAQLVQVAPQAAFAFWQVRGPVASGQQAPLQLPALVQSVPQVRENGSQAWPIGQSAFELQPEHWRVLRSQMLPGPQSAFELQPQVPAMQTLLFAFAVGRQLVQVGPQAVSLLPQVPLPQQAPLQA